MQNTFKNIGLSEHCSQFPLAPSFGDISSVQRQRIDGTSEYPTTKTSRSSSSYIEGREQRENQTSYELVY